MYLDLRFPIGILFSLYGLLLIFYGLVADPRIYERSLGWNVNLIWGVGLFGFGIAMLGLALLANRKRATRGGHRAGPRD